MWQPMPTPADPVRPWSVANDCSSLPATGRRESDRVLHGIIIMMIMGVGATGAGFVAAEHWPVALVLLLVTAIFSGAIVASNPIRSFPDW
jgi:hypothetical protein